jgi:CarboxypepD_reg-like domain
LPRPSAADSFIVPELPVTSKLVCLVWAATLLGNAGVAAQQSGTVSGTVVTAEGAAPLAGASVVIAGTARGVLTNAQGKYSLSVPPGTHTVRARLMGYDAAEQRVTVAAGQTVSADFKLVATPLSLNEVVVVGARTSRTATETPVPVDVISAQ